MLLAAIGLIQQFSAPQAKTELVCSTTSVQAGKPFEVALHMTMAPGFHSYYLNPGESGQATSIKWQIPDRFVAGPIQWPLPKREVVGGVAGFVYENEVWLVTRITPPANLQEGQSIPISADVSWLLCREACVPQKSHVSIDLVVGGYTLPNPAFQPARDSRPTRLTDVNVQAQVKGRTASLLLKGSGLPANGYLFFPADPTFFGAEPASVNSNSSRIRLSIPLSRYSAGSPTRMTGLLMIPNGVHKGVHWIDIPIGNI